MWKLHWDGRTHPYWYTPKKWKAGTWEGCCKKRFTFWKSLHIQPFPLQPLVLWRISVEVDSTTSVATICWKVVTGSIPIFKSTTDPPNPRILASLKILFYLASNFQPKIWGASGGKKKSGGYSKWPWFVHQIKYAHRRWKTASSLTLRSKSSNSRWSPKLKLVAYSPERPGKRRDLGRDASKLDLKTHKVLESQRSRNLFWSLVSFSNCIFSQGNSDFLRAVDVDAFWEMLLV